MGEVLSFRAVKRGYAPEEVDRAFEEIRERIQTLESERVAAEKQVERLSRELGEARSALARAKSKPSFADLGSAFEQTLRLAEEQSAKMTREAHAEAQVVRDGARAEAEELLRTARLAADRTKDEASTASEELLSRTKRQVASIQADADAKLRDAKALLDEAELQAAAMRTDAERYAADVRSRVHEETEDAKAEVATLRQIAEREQLRIANEISLAQEQSERDRQALYEQAVALTAERSREADQLLADASVRAANLSAEVDLYASRTRQEADDALKSARARASDMLTRARRRADTLVTRSNEHLSALLADAETRIDQLDEQRKRIEEFAFELLALTTPDAMVSLDESAVQGETAEEHPLDD